MNTRAGPADARAAEYDRRIDALMAMAEPDCANLVRAGMTAEEAVGLFTVQLVDGRLRPRLAELQALLAWSA